jgi:putative DNA primase/helicase
MLDGLPSGLVTLRNSCASVMSLAAQRGQSDANLRKIFVSQMRNALGLFPEGLACEAFAPIAESHALGEDALVEACTPQANGASNSTGKDQTESKHGASGPRRLAPLDISAFCAMDIKTREMVLGPIVPEKGLAMCYSPRGMGKTRLGTGCGLAVSTGASFLRWQAPKARRVLLIDGEMPAPALQELLKTVLEAAPVKPAPEMFQVLAADLLEEIGIGNLADPKVQHEINQLVDDRGTEFLMLDNLSSLTAVLRDNDEASWQSMKSWLLGLRRRSISVLLHHHAGKGGDQRGTSAREDVLDTVISLRHPSDYRQEEGCRFEVHYTKHRGFYGSDASPFEAQQHTTAFGYEWTVRDITDANQARVAELLKAGLSIRDIAEELKISKSAVHRFKQKIEETSRAN